MIIHCLALALAAGIGALSVRRMELAPEEKPLCFLMYFLPFVSGGYYTYAWALTTAVLLILLWQMGNRNGALLLRCNDTLLALLLLAAGSGLSVLWAADRGMAIWGIVRYVPVVLFAAVLLQLPGERRQKVWLPVPLSGVVMTILSAALQYIPDSGERYIIDGRLAGFFEYPNVFAAFLLAGLVISVTAQGRSKWSWLADAVLIYGVFDSGSRTAFLLMLALLLLMVLTERKKAYVRGLSVLVCVCTAVVLILNALGLDSSVGRFLAISLKSSTMLGRFLYFRDALPVILRHPLGLGYMGYRAMQGTFQTGVYDVAYVHNGILQIFLDAGWIPGLAMTYVFTRSFFGRSCTRTARLLLFAVLGHSMMDFDLEYLAVWLLLLPALRFDDGVALRMQRGQRLLLAIGSVVTCFCVWLAAGDACFRAGRIDLALKLTPFHTQAMEYRLTQLSDIEALEKAADRLLRLNPQSTLGHSAKANAAFAGGDVYTMVREKKAAIACSRYDLEEYCDYFLKLYEYLSWYQNQGDQESARVCASLLQEIPRMLEQVRQETTALAWRLDAKPQLELPPEYRQLLADIASLYIDPVK